MDSGKDEFQYRGKILFFETLKSEITINMIYAGTILKFILSCKTLFSAVEVDMVRLRAWSGQNNITQHYQRCKVCME